MDLQLLQQRTTFLTPFLPYLLKAGEKAAEEAGKKLSEAAWEQAKTKGGKPHPKVETKPVAQEAMRDVARPNRNPWQRRWQMCCKKTRLCSATLLHHQRTPGEDG